MRPYAAPPPGRGQLAGEAAYVVGRDAAEPLGQLRGERLDEVAHHVDPVDVRRGPGEPLLEQGAHHRQHDDGVRARPHEQVLVGDLGGLGAARVDHDHPAAAGLERAQPVREVGHGHQRAVGGHRVGAEDQEVRRAVDVGDRQQELVAVELPGDQLVRDLVDRRGAEAVARAQRLHHRQAVRGRAQGVRVGVAEVDADRVAAVLVDRPRQPVGHAVQGLVPADLHPLGVGAVADPAYRPPQPVGVGVHVGQRDALGADVAARERVRGIAADRDDAGA